MDRYFVSALLSQVSESPKIFRSLTPRLVFCDDIPSFSLAAVHKCTLVCYSAYADASVWIKAFRSFGQVSEDSILHDLPFPVLSTDFPRGSLSRIYPKMILFCYFAPQAILHFFCWILIIDLRRNLEYEFPLLVAVDGAGFRLPSLSEECSGLLSCICKSFCSGQFRDYSIMTFASHKNSNYLFPDLFTVQTISSTKCPKHLSFLIVPRRAKLIWSGIRPEFVSKIPKNPCAVLSRFRFGLLISSVFDLVFDPKISDILYSADAEGADFRQQGSYLRLRRAFSIKRYWFTPIATLGTSLVIPPIFLPVCMINNTPKSQGTL